MRLKAHLDAIYRERVIEGVDRGAAAALATALAQDDTLRAAARAELTRLDALAEACQGPLAERCFVSARRREALAAALAGLATSERS